VAGISGRVTWQGTPAAGLRLSLDYWDGAAWSSRASITTGADGRYSFVGAPGLGNGQLYTVDYPNPADQPNPGPGYLWSWFGNRITTYAAGTAAAGGDFDVADIPLILPADGATVTLPASFCWTPRGIATDNYRLIIYNPETDKTGSTAYLGNVACVDITALPAGWPSGATYRWWVRVYAGSDPDATPYNYGDCYGERSATISFSAQAAAADDSGAVVADP